MDERQIHWENVYTKKQANEVSWTQTVPVTSLDFIAALDLPFDAPIIDIGGGDSKLVDHLLELGYVDVTVLDISEAAIVRAKARLGEKAELVHWIVADVEKFQPKRQYRLWHDRATFHFLTSEEQVQKYVKKAAKYVTGNLVIATFSEHGPDKCSGLSVKQYSEESLNSVLKVAFEKIKCVYEDHLTPFNTIQNFVFCNFRRAVA